MDSSTLISLAGICAVAFLSIYSQIYLSRRKKRLADKIAAGPKVIDVRNPKEYRQDRYPGAINIPVQKLYMEPTKAGPKDVPILVYCQNGSRARRARRILKAYGYKDVTNAGGLEKLKALS
ncbi:rhodanese-like domain-containing protein [Marispirochaeta aestuarii]|uniref:rhodanese-like domain-containing protein n=1 Tax=Marispirochaeta aestuarii TaxID=1963862 RepID=UPI0029C83256|nr:rhodanese-like domain-containing protein [Marispirochaeta aestuarii]